MQRKYHQDSSKKSKRYSEAFKRKVISDIQDGIYSPWRAMQIYGIGGKMTIYKWIAKYNPICRVSDDKELTVMGKDNSIPRLKER
ncbi:MAG: transposase, partial [Candidatus Cloacimonetes bacterium]|nr:transposase [Candidatus Cloacimonadota bacterium]